VDPGTGLGDGDAAGAGAGEVCANNTVVAMQSIAMDDSLRLLYGFMN
jgi:hypothetical protein